MYKIEEMKAILTLNPQAKNFVSNNDLERKRKCEETLRRMGAI